ncbi:MAG: hypothetical protein JWN44_1004 [Myxococcales bacterium]|nr:hypothetical protein [Myxococcales bacterium]
MTFRTLLIGMTLLAGCGGGGAAPSPAYGCDERQGSATPKRNECVDYENVADADLAGLQQSCEMVSGGRWVGGACDHAGAIGGCRVAVGNGAPATVTEVQWWWTGAAGGVVTDHASAVRACASFANSTFVEP